jgi:1-acyl-sn-glycerol-3-phosphate acyltransferase
MLRKILFAFASFLFRILTSLNVTGLENVPKQGPAILAINHLNIIDAPLIFILVPRNDLTALVAKKHHKNPFLRIIVNIMDGIWINRDEADSQAMRAARDHLRKGGLLGIAPEGTRSSTGLLNPAKTGVAYLASKAGVPIIPVALSGTYKGLTKALLLQHPSITVRIGKPIELEPFERKERDAALQYYTDEIMCQIAAMLPPAQRGAYATYPRTMELLDKITASDP